MLLSARRVGPDGTAYGLDASEDMLALARAHAAQAGVGNARFLHGRIEDVPLPDASVDVVISNCVINLAADRPRVLAEAFRVLRPGGRFGVSDITDPGPGRYATAEEYRRDLLAAGFTTAAAVTPLKQAAPGPRPAIVQAAKPASPPGTGIRPMRAGDAAGVLAVYPAGLDTGDAGFETAAPAWKEFDRAKPPGNGHVAVDAATGEVLGWIASALLRAFIDSTETSGIWTIQSGVFPANTAGLRLHAEAGFRVVGTRAGIGRHHGRWRGVVLLERRSPTVGT